MVSKIEKCLFCGAKVYVWWKDHCIYCGRGFEEIPYHSFMRQLVEILTEMMDFYQKEIKQYFDGFKILRQSAYIKRKTRR